MKRALCASGIALCALVVSGAAQAQQKLEWAQTLNLPKGMNLPKDVKVDILGIETGDTFSEAKAKLERLVEEVAPPKKAAPPPPPPNPLTPAQLGLQSRLGLQNLERQQGDLMAGVETSGPFSESMKVFRLQTPSGPLTAEYLGSISMNRNLPGGAEKISETITLYFSAPSSGHQVLAVSRKLYYGKADQPRLADVLQQLKTKLGTTPQVFDRLYRFQYNDGRIYTPANATRTSCLAGYNANTPSGARGVNPTGDCDVTFEVTATPGISPELVSSLEFYLSDNERSKANISADFAYFDTYVRELQSRTRGAPPKL